MTKHEEVRVFINYAIGRLVRVVDSTDLGSSRRELVRAGVVANRSLVQSRVRFRHHRHLVQGLCTAHVIREDPDVVARFSQNT